MLTNRGCGRWGQAAQQQIAGNTTGAITILENQLQEAKVCWQTGGGGQVAQQQVATSNTAGAITTLENELQEGKVC